MNINPKVKIAGGVALAGGGVFMFYQSDRATDKKKKWLYGLAGAGLMISGFFVGKKGVIQVAGLKEQNNVIDKTNEPAQGIISDMTKSESKEKNTSINSGTKPSGIKVDNDNNERTSTLAFNDSKKNADSFDTIMQSTSSVGANPSGHTIKTIPAQKPNIIDKNNNIISANKNDAVRNMGTKVVSRVDPKILERNKIEKQNLLSTISAKENEHKKLIKLNGWHAGLPLRNEISMLKARLHYV